MDKNTMSDVGGGDNNNPYPFNGTNNAISIIKQSPNQYTADGNQHQIGDQNSPNPISSGGAANMMGLFQANINNQVDQPIATSSTATTNDDFYPFGANERELFTNGVANQGSSRDVRHRMKITDKNNLRKPTGGYIKIIAKIILQSPMKKLKLRDIYCELQKNYEFFKESKGKWQNSVRHCLSSNDCFVNEKVNCHSEGKGGYWSVDVKNLPDLSLDCETTNENRRRRRVRQRSSELFYTVPREHILKNLNELTEATLLVYYPDTHNVDFLPGHLRDIFLFVQKKYNLSHSIYSSDFLRKFFREYFSILLSFGTEGFEQAMMLGNQFADRCDGSTSAELHTQMMYHHLDPQLNTQPPPLFTRPPIINMYEYPVNDPNKPPTTNATAFTNTYPKSFDSAHYYQQRVPYVNTPSAANNYDKPMYSFGGSQHIAETPNNPAASGGYSLYKQVTVNPAQLDPIRYNEEYLNSMYSSSAQDQNNSATVHRESQLPLYPQSSTGGGGGGGDLNSYVNPDYGNHQSIPPQNVMVDNHQRCNDVAITKLYTPFDKENISNNNMQNPLLVQTNEPVFNFPPPISHVNNITPSINAVPPPVQPCFNTTSANIAKHGS